MMGNIELHLFKGIPIVHSSDDLIVNRISIETEIIEEVPEVLRSLGVPFEQNLSVPKGKDGGRLGTNSSNSSNKIVKQSFTRDPDGYCIEICNCEVLTDYRLGDASTLMGIRTLELFHYEMQLCVSTLCRNGTSKGALVSRVESRC